MKVIIGTPTARGDIRIEAMRSIMAIKDLVAGMGDEVDFMSVAYAEPALARNIMAHHFLKSDADTLIMHDDDVRIEARIVKRMIECERPFVGVYLPQRKIDIESYANFVRAGLSNAEALEKVAPMVGPKIAKSAKQANNNSIFEVSWIGGAVVVLKREVFETLAATGTVPEYDFQLPDGRVRIAGFFNNISSADGSQHLGEDASFCRRYTEAGGKVHAYRGDGIEHFGVLGFRG